MLQFGEVTVEDPAPVLGAAPYPGVDRNGSHAGHVGPEVVVELVAGIIHLVLHPRGGHLGEGGIEIGVVPELDRVVKLVCRGDPETGDGGVRAENRRCEGAVYLDPA